MKYLIKFNESQGIEELKPLRDNVEELCNNYLANLKETEHNGGHYHIEVTIVNSFVTRDIKDNKIYRNYVNIMICTLRTDTLDGRKFNYDDISDMVSPFIYILREDYYDMGMADISITTMADNGVSLLNVDKVLNDEYTLDGISRFDIEIFTTVAKKDEYVKNGVFNRKLL